jgi:hypothetical protein
MSSNNLVLVYKYLYNQTIYLFEKFNEYFLFFTIIISIITVILTLSIVFESRLYSINKYCNNHLFQSITSPSFLNWLFNSSNHIKKRFFNEFIYSLNEKFFSKKVKKYFRYIQSLFFYFRHDSQSKPYSLLMQKFVMFLRRLSKRL